MWFVDGTFKTLPSIFAQILIANAVNQYCINPCIPTKIKSDFKLGIIHACRTVFPNIPVSGCFFHWEQSIYRVVQAEGLQAGYNDENDRSLKVYTLSSAGHTRRSSSYVSITSSMGTKAREINPVYDYFNQNYVRGVTRRGNRRAVTPRCA